MLQVEDNAGYEKLIHEAFVQSQEQLQIDVVQSGEQAISYLKQKRDTSEAQLPDLILLDLNVPDINGHEVLRYIRADEQLKHIPVIIFSTSDSEKDILQSYQLGANAYVIKPLDLRELIQFISLLVDFWLKTARLPSEPWQH
ncbi:response regulator [Acaryochloris sp. IP29b_bin.137]|uniref:response regulator n=1 Tax=Acaryochloris sp. IP29b_bin.137 TaxID=2969217 RepID=UPI002632835C|nr:response regulator [Acaryochloris sp. IP29b_bin.137]